MLITLTLLFILFKITIILAVKHVPQETCACIYFSKAIPTCELSVSFDLSHFYAAENLLTLQFNTKLA